MTKAHLIRTALGVLGLCILGACEEGSTPFEPAPVAPAPPLPPLADGAAIAPSPTSRALARHYEVRQARLLTQGLLRKDGGGVDTPYTDEDLLRNFKTMAFRAYNQPGTDLTLDGQTASELVKWAQPVRIAVEFGPSVAQAQRDVDRDNAQKYAKRLARVTGHPISVAKRNANLHVLIAGEDDRKRVIRRVLEIVPDISTAGLAKFERLNRKTPQCFVISFGAPQGQAHITRSIALIRAELPDLSRLACLHEELAQGLGLANDSREARPSIFNDDEEFAFLTTHDEDLLRLLYHPDLKTGMSMQEADPILRRLIAARGEQSGS